jgi:hypothetical protein
VNDCFDRLAQVSRQLSRRSLAMREAVGATERAASVQRGNAGSASKLQRQLAAARMLGAADALAEVAQAIDDNLPPGLS